MATRIDAIFTAQDRASAVMRQIGSSADKLESTFTRLQAPLLRAQSLWVSLAGGAIIGGIVNLTKAIDDLDEEAQALGTTAMDLASFRQAGTEAGVGVEKLNTALTKLNVNISQAAAGDPKAAALFSAFGSAALDAAVKAGDSRQVLRALADEFAKLQDGPAKAALAVDLFGKAGAALIPMLNGGADALDRFTGLTAKTVEESRRLTAEFDALGQTWERIKFQASGVLIPAINDVIAVLGRLDLGKIRDEFNTFPLGNFGAAFREYTRQVDAAAVKQKQLRDALALGAGAYSNEGRAALQGAQSVRDKAAADEAAARASSKKAKATNESSNAYAKEFADIARIRANRARAQDEIERDAEEAARRQQDLVDQMTGRTSEGEIQRRIDLLNKMKSGEIAASREEIAIAEASIFGVTQGVNNELEKQGELADQLGLQISSSLGELITTGGKAGDVFKALGQDILKMITQLLILKPLAEEIGKLFKGGSSSGGSGGTSFFGALLGLAGAASGSGGATAFAGGAGMGTGFGVSTGVGTGMGAAMSAPINVYIDGATDRALITSYVEQGVSAGIAASVDSTLRGGSGVIG